MFCFSFWVLAGLRLGLPVGLGLGLGWAGLGWAGGCWRGLARLGIGFWHTCNQNSKMQFEAKFILLLFILFLRV